MVTAEIAVAVPALVLVLVLALGAVTVVTDQLRCVDAARVGARLLARGEDPGMVRQEVARQAPRGAELSLVAGSGSIRVEVSAPLPSVLDGLGIGARPHAVAHAVPEAPT